MMRYDSRVAVVIAALAFGAACAPVAPAPSAQAPTAAAAATANPQVAGPTQAAAPTAADILRIGISASLSGPAARSGSTVDRYIRMGIDDINANGGVHAGGKTYRLEPVTADDKNTSDGGREAGNRLVLAEKVKYILGAISTPSAGVQTVSEPNGALLFAQGAADSSLGPKFPLTFQVVSHFKMRTAAEYDWVVNGHPQAKQVALVASDDLTGHDIARLSRADAEKRGLSVVAEEYYPNDMTDFAPLVLRVLRNNPDVIDVTGAGGRGTVFAPLVKTLTDQGYKGLIIGLSVDTFAFKDVAPLLGENFAVTWPLDATSPKLPQRLRDVLDRYVKQYGESELEIGASVNYSTPLLLAQAMEKAGTVDDPVKVAEALRQGEFEAAWGKTHLVGAQTFGLAVVPEQPIYISSVSNGKPVIIDSLTGTLP